MLKGYNTSYVNAYYASLSQSVIKPGLLNVSDTTAVCVSIVTETKLATHLHCTYSTGRAVKECDTRSRQSHWPHHELHSQQEVSPLLYASAPLHCDQQQRPLKTTSKSFKTLFARSVCFPSLGPVWSKYPALISTHRSFARGLLNINYISIFSLTTRWLLICDLQTATGNYWSGPCCHSDDN